MPTLFMGDVTGLWRLHGGTEKSTSYSVGNHVFLSKMALFVSAIALECWPMMMLMKRRAGKTSPNARDAGRNEVIS